VLSFFRATVYIRALRDVVLCVEPAGYPRIVESPSLKAVEKDRNTIMLCSATGHPEPTISWLKDYVPVDLTDSRFKVLPTGKRLLFSLLLHRFFPGQLSLSSFRGLQSAGSCNQIIIIFERYTKRTLK